MVVRRIIIGSAIIRLVDKYLARTIAYSLISFPQPVIGRSALTHGINCKINIGLYQLNTSSRRPSGLAP